MTPPAADNATRASGNGGDRPDGAEARNGYARPDGVTLLDKVSFLTWVLDTHPVDGGQFKVLYAVVDALLGLEDGKPHNGWCTMGVLATRCRMSKSGVRRALDRLEALGLLKVTPQAGRGGRVYLHVPGVVDAAENLKPRGLKDRTVPETEPNGHDEDAETPSKSARQREVKDVEKPASTRRKSSRQREVNPWSETLDGYESGERARGGAACPPAGAGEPPFEFGSGEGRASGGEEQADALTRPRDRLKRRLAGMAKKVGLQDGGEGLLQASDEDTAQRWMRLQRVEEARGRKGKAKGSQLFKELTQALVDHYELNDKQVGRKLAAKTEPPPPPPSEPRRAPPPQPPPAASPSPSPPPAVRAGPAVRTVAAAIREPWLAPPPASKIVFSDADYWASAVRLGLKPKGLMQ
jgi:MarR family